MVIINEEEFIMFQGRKLYECLSCEAHCIEKDDKICPNCKQEVKFK